MAYTAFPLILSALDLRLSVDTGQVETKKRQLAVYMEAMRLYRKKYDGADRVSDIIDKVLFDAANQSRQICPSVSSPETDSSTLWVDRSIGWSEIFSQHPEFHLRLALALDFALSRGKFPKESDFPVDYRLVSLTNKLVLDGGHISKNLDVFGSSRINSISPFRAGLPSGTNTGIHTPLFEEMYKHLELDFIELFGGVDPSET